MKSKFLIALLTLVCTLCCVFAFSACGGGSSGTYYKLKSNGETDQKTYFILKSGKWEDEDGESGTYKKNGENIIFYITFFGQTEEAETGTLKDKVLTVNDVKYISDKHKHKYGEWETKEATETTDGLQSRVCDCGSKETNILPAGSSGLKYKINFNKTAYSITGIEDKTKTEICIPKIYNGLPVTSIGNKAFLAYSSLESVIVPDSVTKIGEGAFLNCNSLESITIPDGVTKISKNTFFGCFRLESLTIPVSVKSIGTDAFYGCFCLTNINFEGTKSQWEAINKSKTWISMPDIFEKVDKCIVYCNDGTIEV